jgi:glutamate 5-kinase
LSASFRDGTSALHVERGHNVCSDLTAKIDRSGNHASRQPLAFPLAFSLLRGIEAPVVTMPTQKHTRRIVLKFGSGTLTRKNGPGLDLQQFARLSAEVAALIRRGHECVTVTSGAVAAGMSALSLAERPTNLATAQASAAVGQSKLMRAYETAFGRFKLNVAQLLLTHSDLDSVMRRGNARNTLERLLTARNVVPIINENDSVAVEELKFGDNDRLSAEVAMLAGADLLIILTQVDGLLDEDGKVISLVRDIDRVKKLANGSKGRFSVGGMISKLEAVKMAVEAGITTVITNGRRPHAIADAVAGEKVGTRFLARRRARPEASSSDK